jgi:hypothetical protein
MARGARFMQLDLIWLSSPPAAVTDVFGEVFRATDHANPRIIGDLFSPANFLRLSGLIATTGLPRQAQLGLRFGF